MLTRSCAYFTAFCLILISSENVFAGIRDCIANLRNRSSISLVAPPLPFGKWFHYRLQNGAVGLSIIVKNPYDSIGQVKPNVGEIRVVMGSLKLEGDAGIEIDINGIATGGFKGGASAREHMDETFKFSRVEYSNGITIIEAKRTATSGRIFLQDRNTQDPDIFRMELSTENPPKILRIQFFKKQGILRTPFEILSIDRQSLETGTWGFNFNGLRIEGATAARIIRELEIRLRIPNEAFFGMENGLYYRGAFISLIHGPLIRFPAEFTPVEIVSVLNGFYSAGLKPSDASVQALVDPLLLSLDAP